MVLLNRVTVGALCLLSLLLVSAGCSPKATSSRGFRLPDGNAARGQATFVELACHQCHVIPSAGIRASEVIGEQLEIALGGTRTNVVTYGELVTSIINPSHRIARGHVRDSVTNSDGSSKMRSYNDVMTVTELVDLVAFLQPLYEVVPPEYQYRHFAYP